MILMGGAPEEAAWGEGRELGIGQKAGGEMGMSIQKPFQMFYYERNGQGFLRETCKQGA